MCVGTVYENVNANSITPMVNSLNFDNEVSDCQIGELCFQSSTKQLCVTSLTHRHDHNSLCPGHTLERVLQSPW